MDQTGMVAKDQLKVFRGHFVYPGDQGGTGNSKDERQPPPKRYMLYALQNKTSCSHFSSQPALLGYLDRPACIQRGSERELAIPHSAPPAQVQPVVCRCRLTRMLLGARLVFCMRPPLAKDCSIFHHVDIRVSRYRDVEVRG